jgi:hypothetical protein
VEAEARRAPVRARGAAAEHGVPRGLGLGVGHHDGRTPWRVGTRPAQAARVGGAGERGRADHQGPP